ncbi:hypothetical protein C4580_00750 [Candidatus Woesearchaeota archaeon]|nr:MAG: hypothetical protein C4580_00750 [Candidatus Woesearchaeota archaeon]
METANANGNGLNGTNLYANPLLPMLGTPDFKRLVRVCRREFQSNYEQMLAAYVARLPTEPNAPKPETLATEIRMLYMLAYVDSEVKAGHCVRPDGSSVSSVDELCREFPSVDLETVQGDTPSNGNPLARFFYGKSKSA